MKICFALQARFTYLGHAVAMQFKEALPTAEFCATSQVREGWEFLTTQTDIDYGAYIPLEEEIFKQADNETLDMEYLKKFEAAYGIPNLWPYLYIDRIVMHGQYRREYPYDKALLSHEQMLRHVQAHSKEVVDFLDREKPDVIVFSVIGSVASMLLYHVAKKRGIKTFVIKGTRVGNRMTFTQNYLTLDTVQKRFAERMAGGLPVLPEAQKFLNEFRTAPKSYLPQATPTFNKQAYRSGNVRFLNPARLIPSLAWYAKAVAHDLSYLGRHDYTHIRIGWTMWDKCKRKVRGLIGYEKFYSKPNLSERFAYYPLHVEPETAILLDSPYHTDQLELIRAAAHALPIDMLLYVKEHPQMVGYRTRSYYKEIAKIPNVRLIDPRIVGSDLVKQAALVFTITGTGGFESALFGKPVITFTDVYYNDLSSVTTCRDFDKLPYVVKERLEEFTPDEQEIVQYVSALIDESVDVDYGGLWVSGRSSRDMSKDEDLKQFTGLLLQYIKRAR